MEYYILFIFLILVLLYDKINISKKDNIKKPIIKSSPIIQEIPKRGILDSIKSRLFNNIDPHLDLGLNNSLDDDEPLRSAVIPINIETRGKIPNYEQVGFVFNEDNDLRLPLFGRQKYIGSNQYEYYVQDESRNHIKIPLDIKGDKELFDEEEITINSYEGNYKISLYDREKLRYIPYV